MVDITFKDIKFPPKNAYLNVDSTIKSQKFTGIIGPSGSGKTTLIKILSGRNTNYSGAVEYDEKVVSKQEQLQSSVFVHQDDIFLPFLTVKETINFYEKLRNKKQHSLLELDRILNSYIGTSDKGISAGERKRLSIVISMIDDADIFFLDEPTSGLDSLNALNMIKILKELKGTRVCVIHQPSAEIFFLFDEIIVMNDGMIVYQDNPHNIFNWFNSLNFKCPKYSNPADFVFTDVLPKIKSINNQNEEEMSIKEFTNLQSNTASEDLSTFTQMKQMTIDESVSHQDIHTNALKNESEQFMHEITYKLQKNGNNNNNFINSSEYVSSEELNTNKPITKYSHEPIKKERHNSWIMEFLILFERNRKSLVRDKMIGIARIIQSLVTAIIISLVYCNTYEKELIARGKNIAGVMYIFAMNCLFSSAMSSIPELYKSQKILKREYQNRYFRYSSFFFAKISIDTLLNQIHVFILIPIVCLICRYNTGIMSFMVIFSASILTCLIGHSYAILASAICPSVQSASALLPAFIMPLTLVNGVFVDTNTLFIVFKAMQYISPTRYTLNIMMKSEFKDFPKEFPRDQLCNWHVSIYQSFIIMIAMYTVNVLLAFFLLRRKINKKV